MTLRGMFDGISGMDAAEYAGWKRFYRRCPFGVYREDMQAGIVANACRRKPLKLEEYLLVPVERPKITAERLRQWVIKQGGYVNVV